MHCQSQGRGWCIHKAAGYKARSEAGMLQEPQGQRWGQSKRLLSLPYFLWNASSEEIYVWLLFSWIDLDIASKQLLKPSICVLRQWLPLQKGPKVCSHHKEHVHWNHHKEHLAFPLNFQRALRIPTSCICAPLQWRQWVFKRKLVLLRFLQKFMTTSTEFATKFFG